MKRKCLSLFVSLILCLALLPTGVCAAGGSYLALGDSITTGYAPASIKFNGRVDHPFADQVKTERKYDSLSNLAADGETAETLNSKLASLSSEIAGASLITITIGGNDLMNALYGFLVEQYNSGRPEEQPMDLDSLKAALADLSKPQNQMLLLGVMGYIGGFDGSPAETAALDTFEENLGDMVNQIRAENSTVPIVIATQYNPYRHIDDASAQGIVTAFENGVVHLNERITKVAESKNLIVADVYTAFQQNGGQLTNAAFSMLDMTNASLDFHPNQAGHDLIARTILQSLPQDGGETHDVPEPMPFPDVPGDVWYTDAVSYVCRHGLMAGTTDTTFSPDTTTSRSMIATILWHMAGSPVVNYAMDFSDVPQGQWYSEGVRWAASEGIVGGYGNGAFGTDDPITREQFAVMLYQFAQEQGYDVSIGEDTNILSYSDVADVAEYAIPAMQWACGAGVISGSGSALVPQGQATRAQAAVMLMAFCEEYVAW